MTTELSDLELADWELVDRTVGDHEAIGSLESTDLNILASRCEADRSSMQVSS